MIKVILKKDVAGIGKEGEICSVKDGHATNYLIPKGLAVIASTANMDVFQAERSRKRKEEERKTLEANNLKQVIDRTVLNFVMKVGDNGKPFGSITSKDISEKLSAEYNLVFDKKKILLEEAIKTIGTSYVDVKIYPGIIGRMTVEVKKA